MQQLDLIVFLLYMSIILGFGISFYFRKGTALDYVTGGGKLPAWALGMSIFATYVSSISFLALPGSAYQGNWNGFVFSLSIPIATFTAVKYFIPLYRKIQSPSAYEYFESRFGLWARIYASSFYLFTQLARMGAIMYLLALPMHALFGWSIPIVILITGLVVMVYASLGGITAVVWTDAIQGIVLITGALGCLIYMFWNMPGGLAQVGAIASNQEKFSLGSFNLNVDESTFWVVFFYGLFINLQNFGVDQSYIQRYKNAKSIQDANRSTWMGSLLYIPVSFLFFMIGTTLFAYYQVFESSLPQGLTELENADKVFPYFIATVLPCGISGLMIAAIFAAGMSTLSTSINSSATVLLEDHYKRYVVRKSTSIKDLRVLQLASLAMGAMGILIGLAFNGAESALNAWWALASIFSGGVLGLFFLAFLSNTKYRLAVGIAVATGLLVIGWISLTEYFPKNYLHLIFPIHPNMAIVLGTTAIFVVGWVLNTLMKLFDQKKNDIIPP